ncbi:hypothetical protein [Paenibacillus caui]|uniref:hypothetical protein n=1 Tax=Paenibacillus caui TaxID=2873927 RepID=UPI001CA95716|nr:hypothetical protein [Paenibacillus caui]
MSFSVRKAEKKDVHDLSRLFYEFIGKESDVHAMQQRLEDISGNPNYYVAVACDVSSFL